MVRGKRISGKKRSAVQEAADEVEGGLLTGCQVQPRPSTYTATMIYNDAVKTNIEWLSSLDTEREISANLRRTSIIATIGPKTNSVEMMNKLRDNGMNIVRMNFSHGSYEYHQSVINNAREAERVQVGRPLAIALDTVSSHAGVDG